MKFIGQFIQSLVARFRNDVYLEDVSTGTIASGGNLGLDANNKIVKATGVSSASTVTVTDSNIAELKPVVFHDESNTLLDDQSFKYQASSSNLQLSADNPGLNLFSTTDDATDARIIFQNTRGGNGGSNDDALGSVFFTGRDSGGGNNTFAEIKSEIANAAAGSEAGRLKFNVAENDGTLTTGLKIEGQASDDGEVDVTIGAGTGSTATIAGGFNAGGSTLSYASEILTILSTTSEAPNFNLMNNNTNAEAPMIQFFKLPTGADDDEIGEITFRGNNDGGAAGLHYATFKAYIADASNNDEAGKLEMKVATNSTEIQNAFTATGLGTGSRVDVNLGHGATSTTTIAGTLTMGSTAFVNNSGVVQVATQGTIDHDSLANFVAAEHVDWASASAGTIHSTNIPTLNQDTSGTAAGLSATLAVGSGGTGQTTVQAAMNALAGGVLNGKYLRGDGADVTLATIQAGDVPTLNQNTTGQAGTVATITGLAPDTATTQATQPNITTMTGFLGGTANALVTDDGDGTVTSESQAQIVTQGGLSKFLKNTTANDFLNNVASSSQFNLYEDVVFYDPTNGSKTNRGMLVSLIKGLNADYTSGTLEQIAGSFNTTDPFSDNTGATVNQTALSANVTGNSSGTTTGTGLSISVIGSDVNDGITIATTDGSASTGHDIKISSSVDTDDYFAIRTFGSGETEITTVDSDSANAADLSVDIDGDITLDSVTGNIIGKANGSTYTPSADNHLATKKYVDDNIPDEVVDNGQTFIWKHVHVTADATDCNSMHTTPKELIAAQGSGTIIVLGPGYLFVDKNTAIAQAVSAADLNFHFADQEPGVFGQTSLMHIRRFMNADNADRIFMLNGNEREVGQSLTDGTNKAIEASFDSAITSNSMTKIEFYLSYYVITL